MSDIPHIGFIVAAYLVTAAAILVMIGAIVVDYRRLTRALSRLDAAREEDDAQRTRPYRPRAAAACWRRRR